MDKFFTHTPPPPVPMDLKFLQAWICFMIVFFSEYKKKSIEDFGLTEQEKSMYAVWRFPVSNYHINMFMRLNDDRYLLADDYDDAVFKMTNGSRKGRNYYAFFSKLSTSRGSG